MDETPKTFSPEAPVMDTGRWIGLGLTAVILGEGIWGLVVSLTNNLVLPLLARTMGGDAQSPLYLGKGDINVPAVFTSVLELCFAGIAAVILNSWVRRKPRRTVVRVRATATDPRITVPSIAAVVQPSAPVAAAPGQFWSPPEAAPRPAAAPVQAAPVKAKAQAPKEIIYNSVGEPINPTEGE